MSANTAVVSWRAATSRALTRLRARSAGSRAGEAGGCGEDGLAMERLEAGGLAVDRSAAACLEVACLEVACLEVACLAAGLAAARAPRRGGALGGAGVVLAGFGRFGGWRDLVRHQYSPCYACRAIRRGRPVAGEPSEKHLPYPARWGAELM
ncbi:hypothetical protein WJ978_28550 [Achromobacter xylosoxidans]